MMKRALAAIGAGSAVVLAQVAGSQYGPTRSHARTRAWYAALRKPSFTPPGPVFGVAWTALDVLSAFAGYRLLPSKPSAARNAALAAWSLNLVGVAGFSWVLFGRKKLDQALGVTAGMMAATSATVATAAMVDRKAAYAGMPLLAWVAFATLLQEEVWRRNV